MLTLLAVPGSATGLSETELQFAFVAMDEEEFVFRMHGFRGSVVLPPPLLLLLLIAAVDSGEAETEQRSQREVLTRNR